MLLFTHTSGEVKPWAAAINVKIKICFIVISGFCNGFMLLILSWMVHGVRFSSWEKAAGNALKVNIYLNFVNTFIYLCE